MKKLTELQKDLLIGTLLGNGNLQTITGETWRYRAVHKSSHYIYILNKYNVLKDMCKTEPCYSKHWDPCYEVYYERYSFNTLTDVRLRYYGKLFYVKENNSWVKQIPKNIHKFLTARSLAYWYMDDGALKWKGRSNAVRLCTDSFLLEEVELLKNGLITVFGLKVSINKQNDKYRLSISEDSYPVLKSLILPYLLPCMYYKFPDGNKGVYNNDDLSNDIINTFVDRSK